MGSPAPAVRPLYSPRRSVLKSDMVWLLAMVCPPCSESCLPQSNTLLSNLHSCSSRCEYWLTSSGPIRATPGPDGGVWQVFWNLGHLV